MGSKRVHLLMPAIPRGMDHLQTCGRGISLCPDGKRQRVASAFNCSEPVERLPKVRSGAPAEIVTCSFIDIHSIYVEDQLPAPTRVLHLIVGTLDVRLKLSNYF